MGGGKLKDELWIHPEINWNGIPEKIKETIYGNDEFKWIKEELDDYIVIEFELYSKDWTEFVTNLDKKFDILKHATEQRYEDLNFYELADLMCNLQWIDKDKNIKVVIYGDISLDVKKFMIGMQIGQHILMKDQNGGGAGCISIYDKTLDRFVIIFASSTD